MEARNPIQNGVLSNKSSVSIACGSRAFWAINESGMIQKFVISGNTIIPDSVVCTSAPGQSLAVCNNLNSNSLSPTFYININGGNLSYLNGNGSWDTVPQIAPHEFHNSGGNGDYLYLLYNGSLPGLLIKYDGVSYTTIYSNNNYNFAVADVAVDNSGNAWFITATDLSMNKIINVISPSGENIKQYPFNLNTLNAYGCFLLNDVLYIGLGSGHHTYPNSLIPITFSNDSAYMGTPLTMPVNTWVDLASCSRGASNTIEESSISFDFKLYPNPANGFITIELEPLGSKNNKRRVSIYNIMGELLLEQEICQMKSDINISRFAKGSYILKLETEANLLVKKFMIE
jgi:hypothetical protein